MTEWGRSWDVQIWADFDLVMMDWDRFGDVRGWDRSWSGDDGVGQVLGCQAIGQVLIW